jgi:NAD(P)-dependent dehydrogenase (short-subunit alcohol dehydrogenase family)
LTKYITGNAGIMACPYTKTVGGFESQFVINHLAHFFLTTSLIPELEAGKPSRIVVISSLANKRGNINWNDIYVYVIMEKFDNDFFSTVDNIFSLWKVGFIIDHN